MSPTDSGKPKATTSSSRVFLHILSVVDAFLADPEAAEAQVAAIDGRLPAEVLRYLAAIEDLPRMQPYTHRDVLLIQLGFGLLAEDDFDHGVRAEGARTVGGKLGAAFKERHVPALVDAYQNVGKNITNLRRGNVPAFDALLGWMNGQPVETRTALFNYITARAALKARPVLAMPGLRVASLTFVRVGRLIDRLLATPSGGAFEQFAVAAFLDALLYEFGLGGTVGGLRVVTKNINASDASSGTAADVQILRGNKIEEVFEVSANDWRSKVQQAVNAAVNADQPRAHIIAALEPDERDFSDLDGAAADVTVADVRSFLRIMTAALRKPSREYALTRLYELVDRNQPNTELTNGFVLLLGSLELTAD